MIDQRRQIGIFGGTFDPPHLGHLLVAEFVRDELGLDEVWFVVANDPWQKDGTRSISDASLRLQMADLATADVEHLLTCSVELENGGPSYSIDTLTTLSERHPDVDWHLIVGADAAAGLNTWHRAPELRGIANIVEVTRPGAESSLSPAGWNARQVRVPAIEISSTVIRDRLGKGRSVRFMTPDSVITLAASLGLYCQDS